MTGATVLEVFWSVDNEHQCCRFEKEHLPLTIGRAPNNQFVLVDQSVSRQHAEIFLTAQGLFIRDLHSRFGTVVEHVALEPGVAKALPNESEIRFGRQKVQIRVMEEEPSQQEFVIWALHELQQRLEQVHQFSLQALQDVTLSPELLAHKTAELRNQFLTIEHEAHIWSTQNTLLQQLNTLLNQTKGHHELLQQALPLIAHVMHAERGFVLMFEPREQRFAVAAAYQYPTVESQDPDASYSLLLARHSFEQKLTLLFDHPEEIRAFQPLDCPAPWTLKSLMVLPLCYGDEVLAVIYLDQQQHSVTFSQVQQSFLKTLQLQLALALKSAISLSRALSDDLTGVYSRNMIEEQITLAMDQAKRYGHPCSLLFLDIDNFKHINDQFGHLVGDEVLKKVAAVLQQLARKTDVVGRLGGEEFVLLLTATPLEGAVLQAERIRHDIARLRIHVGQIVVPVTASIGVADYHLPLNNQAYRFIECADQAMYQAKRRGKNQVCVHQPLDEPLLDTDFNVLRVHSLR